MSEKQEPYLIEGYQQAKNKNRAEVERLIREISQLDDEQVAAIVETILQARPHIRSLIPTSPKNPRV